MDALAILLIVLILAAIGFTIGKFRILSKKEEEKEEKPKDPRFRSRNPKDPRGRR